MSETRVIQGWIEQIGYRTTLDDASLVRVHPTDDSEFPPFFVQCTSNWVLFSVLPVITGRTAEGLHRRMLSANREMKLAKFALGIDAEVVLCAELPTEALDRSEVQDAARRMVRYVQRYRDYLLSGLPAPLPSVPLGETAEN